MNVTRQFGFAAKRFIATTFSQKQSKLTVTFPKSITENNLKLIFAQWKPTIFHYRAVHEINFAARNFCIINYPSFEECAQAVDRYKNDPVIVQNEIVLNVYEPDPTKLYVGNISKNAKSAVYNLFQDQILLRRYAHIVFESSETIQQVIDHFKTETQTEIELYTSNINNNKRDEQKMKLYASFSKDVSEQELTDLFSKWSPKIYYSVSELDPKKFAIKSFAMLHYDSPEKCLEAAEKYLTNQFVRDNSIIFRPSHEDPKKLYIANILPESREYVYKLVKDQLVTRGHAYVLFESEDICSEALLHFSNHTIDGLRVSRAHA
jgi:adenylate kinase family enzyme